MFNNLKRTFPVLGSNQCDMSFPAFFKMGIINGLPIPNHSIVAFMK